VRKAYEVELVRAAEQALMANLPEGTLMQRAAAGVARRCNDLLGGVYGARVVLLVGSGDNGGDALYAGARLASRGARVDALLLSEQAHSGGLEALHRAGGRVVVRGAVAADGRGLLATADLVVDGVIGIGGKGGLREDAAALVASIPTGCLVLAVDIPSGVDASTGEVAGECVAADVTVTFGTYKPGHLIDPGAAFAGVVELLDIGPVDSTLEQATAEAFDIEDVARLLPVPVRESDKYSRGVLGILAGSARYPGAAVLCTGGALHGGAGYVRVAAVPGLAGVVRQAWPEAVVGELDESADPTSVGRVQAWAVGPGIETDEAGLGRVRAVLEAGLPTVVDASGLELIRQERSVLQRRTADTLLTPHAGELARLLDVERADVEARRLEHVRRAADALGAVVLLKGSTTLIALPGSTARPIRVNPTGTPWLGTAGTGDVLTGLLGSLLASGLTAYDAASAGAWVHGLAARLSSDEGPITASDLPRALRTAFATVMSS
jgi:hydroxyethylthiazole kinase-like uncharacterized protein yjeF